MTGNEYRRKHHRCRTCVYATPDNSRIYIGWRCTIKNVFAIGPVEDTKLKGILCGLYAPKEYEK